MATSSDKEGNIAISQYTNYELDDKELRLQLTRRDTQIALAVNYKENALYETVELQTGEQWFNPASGQNKRFGFRKVFSFGVIGIGASLAIIHNITGVTLYTHIYGTAVTAIDNRPIPYSSVTAATAQIEVNVTGTKINVINGATAPAIVSGIIVLEYLKQ